MAWTESPRLPGVNLTPTDFLCRMVASIRYSGRFWSTFTTVIITIERWITIKFPFKVSRISTPLKAKITILFIILISSGLGSYPFATMGLINYGPFKGCGVLKKYINAYDTLNNIIMEGLNHITSITLVTIFTFLIIYELAKMRKFRNETSQGKTTDDRLINILLSVAVSFLLLRIPYLCAYEISTRRDSIWKVK